MNLTRKLLGSAAVLAGALALSQAALAEVKVGVTIAATGPAATIASNDTMICSFRLRIDASPDPGWVTASATVH